MKDILKEIIEKTLFESNANSHEGLEEKIVEEYLSELKENRIHIPLRFKKSLIEDLKSEIRLKLKN